MSKHQPRSIALLESLVRTALAELNAPPRPRDVAAPKGRADIVDRRDESGIKIPQDFPNPSGSVYRGCF